MPLSNPFRRSTDRPSLRERAAALRASFRPAAPVASPTPDSGDAELLSLVGPWEAAVAAYDTSVQTQIAVSEKAPTLEAPPAREPYDEWQRLIPGWRERTGIDAAETASREAIDVVNEIEDCIASLPATTMAGLRLKVRVAQRSDDIECVWPDGLSEGLVRDILAMGEPEIGTGADAELIRLGHRFEAARVRAQAANEACNSAGREADQRLPQRPDALTLREADHALRVYQWHMHPLAFEGVQLRAGDVEWLRGRMPMKHEILRPIQPGERAHIDHPGRRFDVVPHPEAQARAEEIITAWDAWRAEINQIYSEHLTQDLEATADAAGAAVEALAERIADCSAHTAAGLLVKLRALNHFRRNTLLAEIPTDPDPDQLLAHSLWCDMQDEPAVGAAAPARATDLLDRDLSREAFDYVHGLSLIAVPFGNLTRLYEAFQRAYDLLSDTGQEDQFWALANSGIQTAGGKLIDAEQNRIGCLRDACAMELAKRIPASEEDRDAALVVRLRHEMLCEPKIRDSALLSDIRKAWAAE